MGLTTLKYVCRMLFCVYMHAIMHVSGWCTCVVLCQILVFVLLLLLAKPGTAGLLLLLGLLHGYTRHSPTTDTHGQSES